AVRLAASEECAAVAVHSTTKSLGGHSDTIGGAVVSADPDWSEHIHLVQKAVGAVPGAFDAFLVHRGLRTPHLRMRAHAESASPVAAFLRGVEGVEDVRCPGFSGMV